MGANQSNWAGVKIKAKQKVYEIQVESRTQIKSSEDPVFVSLGKAGK